MNALGNAIVIASLLLLPSFAPAQVVSFDQIPPDTASPDARFQSFSDVSTGARRAATSLAAQAANPNANLFGIQSVPVWSSAFAYGGTVYPYTMVGRPPQHGGTTNVKTALIPVALYFEGYLDSAGNPLVIAPDSILPLTLLSPNFQSSSYDSGFTQFGDAVQRAQFWSVQGQDWHTLLGAPRLLKPVTIHVPFVFASVIKAVNGSVIGKVDIRFFQSQIRTILELEPLHADEFAIVLTRNNVLYQNGVPTDCCIVGYHSAYETSSAGSSFKIQTYAWAGWVDSGYLRAGFADITGLSHEIAEWLNDPFVDNTTPSWSKPGTTACQSNLETGDAIEALPNPSLPVTIDGYTYHPQNEALLQWFTRTSPSDAIGGAYSFPDTSLLTSPSKPCGF